MSTAEITEEVSKLKEVLGDKADFLLRQGLQKRGLQDSSLPESLKIFERVPHTEESTKSGNLRQVDFEFSGSTFKFTEEDAARLAWTAPLEPEETEVLPVRLTSNLGALGSMDGSDSILKSFLNDNSIKPKNEAIAQVVLDKLRFDFNGAVTSHLIKKTNKTESNYTIESLTDDARAALEEKQANDDLFFHKGLHHHGVDPELPGYTLSEALELAQSSTSSQAALGLRIVSHSVLRGLFCLEAPIISNFKLGSETEEQFLQENDHSDSAVHPLAGFGLSRGRLTRFLLGPLCLPWRLRACLDDRRPSVSHFALLSFLALLAPHHALAISVASPSTSVPLSSFVASCLALPPSHPQTSTSRPPPSPALPDSALFTPPPLQWEESSPSLFPCLLSAAARARPPFANIPVSSRNGAVSDGLALELSILSPHHAELDDAKLLAVDVAAALILRTSLIDRLVAMIDFEISSFSTFAEMQNTAACLLLAASLAQRSKEIARLLSLAHPPLLRTLVSTATRLTNALSANQETNDNAVFLLCFSLLECLKALSEYGGESASKQFAGISIFISLSRLVLSSAIPMDAAVATARQTLPSDWQSCAASAACDLLSEWMRQGVWAEDVPPLTLSFNACISKFDAFLCSQADSSPPRLWSCSLLKLISSWLSMASLSTGRTLDGLSASAALPGASVVLKRVLERMKEILGIEQSKEEILQLLRTACACVSFLGASLQRVKEEIGASVEDIQSFGALADVHLESFSASLDGSFERSSIASSIMLRSSIDLVNILINQFLSTANLGAAMARVAIEAGGLDSLALCGDTAVSPCVATVSLAVVCFITRLLTCARRLRSLDFLRTKLRIGSSLVENANVHLLPSIIQETQLHQIASRLCIEADLHIEASLESGEYPRPFSGVSTLGPSSVHLAAAPVLVPLAALGALIGELVLLPGVDAETRRDMGMHALLVAPTVYQMKSAAREALPGASEALIDAAVECCLVPSNVDVTADETTGDALCWRAFAGGLLSLLRPSIDTTSGLVLTDDECESVNPHEVVSAVNQLVKSKIIHPLAALCAIAGSLPVLAGARREKTQSKNSSYSGCVPAKEAEAVGLLMLEIFEQTKKLDQSILKSWTEDLGEACKVAVQTFQDISYLDKCLAMVVLSFASPALPMKVREGILNMDRSGAAWILLKRAIPDQIAQIEKEDDFYS